MTIYLKALYGHNPSMKDNTFELLVSLVPVVSIIGSIV